MAALMPLPNGRIPAFKMLRQRCDFDLRWEQGGHLIAARRAFVTRAGAPAVAVR